MREHVASAGVESGEEPYDSSQVRKVRSERFQSIYTNQAAVNSSPFDFRITLQELGSDVNDKLFITEHAVAVMSPQMAKALAIILIANVRKFEEANGMINMKMFDAANARQAEPEPEAAPPLETPQP